MKERQREKLTQTIYVAPGDRLNCTLTDKYTGKVYRFKEDINRFMTIDTVVTFEFENGEVVLGLSDGIGAIFGLAANSKPKPKPKPLRNEPEPWYIEFLNTLLNVLSPPKNPR